MSATANAWSLPDADRESIHRNVDAVLALPMLRGVSFQIAGFTGGTYLVNTLCSGRVTPDEMMKAVLHGLEDMLAALDGKEAL